MAIAASFFARMGDDLAKGQDKECNGYSLRLGHAEAKVHEWPNFPESGRYSTVDSTNGFVEEREMDMTYKHARLLGILVAAVSCQAASMGRLSAQNAGLVQVASAPTIDSLALAFQRDGGAPPALPSARPPELSPSDKPAGDDQGSSNGSAEDAGDLKNNESLAPLQSRDLSPVVTAVNLSLSGLGTGLVPEPSDRVMPGVAMLPDGVARNASFKCVHWRPSAICHYPLYFQESMLERHGHVRFGHLQPIASGVRFFSTFPLLPYMYALTPPCTTQYAIGQYRPGTCAPLLKDHLPWDKRAAVVETLSLAGYFWASPL